MIQEEELEDVLRACLKERKLYHIVIYNKLKVSKYKMETKILNTKIQIQILHVMG